MEDRNEEAVSTEAKSTLSKGTSHSAAFMDRLRIMATELQQGRDKPFYQLSESKADCDNPDVTDKDVPRVPRPVAAPTGEHAEITNDIIAQQQEFPWQIRTEARAPTILAERAITPKQLRRREEISQELRRNLEQKRASASKWAAKNTDSKRSQGGKKHDFSPQQFHKMVTARER
jgi:hypothetical protein